MSLRDFVVTVFSTVTRAYSISGGEQAERQAQIRDKLKDIRQLLLDMDHDLARLYKLADARGVNMETIASVIEIKKPSTLKTESTKLWKTYDEFRHSCYGLDKEFDASTQEQLWIKVMRLNHACHELQGDVVDSSTKLNNDELLDHYAQTGGDDLDESVGITESVKRVSSDPPTPRNGSLQAQQTTPPSTPTQFTVSELPVWRNSSLYLQHCAPHLLEDPGPARGPAATALGLGSRNHWDLRRATRYHQPSNAT